MQRKLSWAPGPDGIPGYVLKVCAEQPAHVFTNINTSLLQTHWPPSGNPTGSLATPPSLHWLQTELNSVWRTQKSVCMYVWVCASEREKEREMIFRIFPATTEPSTCGHTTLESGHQFHYLCLSIWARLLAELISAYQMVPKTIEMRIFCQPSEKLLRKHLIWHYELKLFLATTVIMLCPDLWKMFCQAVCATSVTIRLNVDMALQMLLLLSWGQAVNVQLV